MTRYADSAALALGIARVEARSGGAPAVEPEHLLLGLSKLCRSDIDDALDGGGLSPAKRHGIRADADLLRRRFARAGVDPTALRHRLRAALVVAGAEPAPGATPHRNRAARRAFTRAADMVTTGQAGAVELLRAVLESPTPRCREVFCLLDVADPFAAFFPEEQRRPAGDQATPFLDRYGRDLTRLAHDGRLPTLIGRREELRTLARVLVKQRKANAVLVGDAGVGKTGIVEGLATLLTGPGAPAALSGARLVELSMSALVAGTKYRGEFEERIQGVLSEAREAPELILFIDELHTVLGAGGKGASDAANILKPALARGELRCVGATTPGEYRQYIEADPALRRRFELLRIDEPTTAQAVEILAGLVDGLADHHGVDIADEVPDAAVGLAVRYLPELRLPDKAIDLVDQACAAARIQTVSPDGSAAAPGRVGRAELAAILADRTGLPLERITASETRRLLDMEEHLRRRVAGQDEAIDAVADVIRTSRAGLGDPRRPIGVFLFAGPTGTGKTELAKALAEFLFDDERRLVRVDMSEYQERHSVARLLGAPPGYVGHDREGQLSGPLREHPHSVVLFDEVEKAHPDVLGLFLQIFDEGRLTDAQGRRVSFAETVVILTSNLGAGPPGAGMIGFGRAGQDARDGDAQAQKVIAALRGSLRPELLGRIGRVVVFAPLVGPALRQVLDKAVDRFRDRLAGRGISLELAEGVYEVLLRRSDHARAGARALEQTVDRVLIQPLGQELLTDRFAGAATIRVEARDSALVFTAGEAANA